jgi:hypothetical protein
VLIEDFGFAATAGKDGILYVVKSNNMGKTRPAELHAPAGNYGKLAVPPIWFTCYPEPEVNAAPSDISTLNQLFFSAPSIGALHRSVGAAPSMERCCSAGERTAICAPGASVPMV